jgi:hypothetical protein
MSSKKSEVKKEKDYDKPLRFFPELPRQKHVYNQKYREYVKKNLESTIFLASEWNEYVKSL